jgi:murein DD-endopeptidase MepM/ murein hydrolase activator NlpD
MSRRRFSSRAVQMALFLAFIALTATIMHAYAAYRVSVPIVENDGHIRQDYLYGEGAAIHKGVDYPVATGTTVHAIADGVAVQVLESIPNGCHT